MTPPPARRRLWARTWPWLAAAGWFAGLIALGSAGRANDWSPGRALAAALGWTAVPAVLFRTAVRNMFGPVFVYEVVRLGRRRGTILWRLFYVLTVLAVLALMYFSWLDSHRGGRGGTVNPHKLAEFATDFFYVFQVLQYAVVVLLTPAYVAGCIADEKERKTLEFLLATDLSGHEIVFGKLAARVMTLLMYVLAGLPVVAFLQLFGGIDPDLLLAGTAASVGTVLGLSALSIYFSVSLKKPRDAIALTYLAVAVYAVGTAALGGVTHGLARTVSWGTLGVVGGRTVEWVDVFVALRDGFDWVASGNAPYAVVAYLGTSRGVVTPAGINAVLLKFGVFWGVTGVALLAYSVTRLRAIALRQASGAPGPVRRGRRGRALAAAGRPRVCDDAMLWKEVFAEGSGRGGCLGSLMAVTIALLVFFTPLAGLCAAFAAYVPVVRDLFGLTGDTVPIGRRLDEYAVFLNGWVRVATGVLSTLLMLGAAVRGAGTVSGERDRDTWVSLVATPLTVGEMLRGKFLGVVFGMRRLATALVLVWATALAFGAVEPALVLASAVALAVYVSAFAWLGIFCSVTARTTTVATVRAVLASAFFVGGYVVVGQLCCCLPFLLVSPEPRALNGEPVYSVALVVAGSVPPLVMGWLPMQNFGTGRAQWMFSGDTAAIGALAPAVGLALWVGFGAFLATLSSARFAVLSNRTADGPPRREGRP